MGHGEFDLVALLLEVKHHAGGLLAAVELVVHRLEGVGELARRIVFEHLALDDQLTFAVEVDGRADLPLRGRGIAEPEFPVASCDVSALNTFSGVEAI